MKTTIITLCLILCAGMAFGASQSWGPPNGGGPVDGYRVYFHDVANPEVVYGVKVVGATEVPGIEQALHLAPATDYLFWVTAYNSRGESGPSNVVGWRFDIVPYAPPADVLPEPYDWVLIPVAPGGAKILQGTQ